MTCNADFLGHKVLYKATSHVLIASLQKLLTVDLNIVAHTLPSLVELFEMM